MQGGEPQHLAEFAEGHVRRPQGKDLRQAAPALLGDARLGELEGSPFGLGESGLSGNLVEAGQREGRDAGKGVSAGGNGAVGRRFAHQVSGMEQMVVGTPAGQRLQEGGPETLPE